MVASRFHDPTRDSAERSPVTAWAWYSGQTASQILDVNGYFK
jgi:hypothetical protein